MNFQNRSGGVGVCCNHKLSDLLALVFEFESKVRSTANISFFQCSELSVKQNWINIQGTGGFSMHLPSA